ncbi:MAG: DUF3520 domain-containing protein [Candidatus Didemnitutus sp.]|nr:DUF3520 domain-containing protein [Candidatus Didemnitutus sp.]
MSASARSPSSAAVVAELQSRHATEVRSYAVELWDGDEGKAGASVATFWREWVPPPGVADEIPREFVFAAARRQIVADLRRAGANQTEAELETDAGAEAADASARIAGRFRRLTSKQQEMVRLHLKHRFDLDEIAEIAELTPANAAQVLHTAIGRLNGSAHDDPRAVRLALAGASGEALAGEAPERRAHVAELRVTLEVARQVLARGAESFRPRPRGNRRRAVWIWAFALGVAVTAAATVWWARREPSTEGEAPEALAAEAGGQQRVAIRRVAGEAPPAERQASAVEDPAFPSAASGRPANRPRVASVASKTEVAETAASDRVRAASGKQLASAKPAASGVERQEPPARGEGVAAVAKNIPPNTAQTAGAAAEVDRLIQATPPASVPANAREEPRAVAAERERGAAETTPTRAAPRVDSVAPPTREPAAATEELRAVEQKPLRPLADKLDTAPIAALRKALTASRWPARREVNVGAMLGALPPSPEAPRSDAPVFSTRVESSVSPWNAARRLVRVAVRARENAPTTRAPATVILLLDVSGSMDAPNRLPLVQAAVAGLLRRLRPEDRVGIVTYAGEPTILLPPARLTNEREVRAAIDALEAKGRTNGGAGLREAFAMAAADAAAGGEHVVILCTDGDFNMGATSEAELGTLIDGHRDAGVRLAIFGFGRPDRIDPRLEALAARARGGSGYVNTRAEAEQALVSQLDQLFAPVAEQVSATVEFDPVRVARVRRVGDDEMTPVVRGAEIPIAQRGRVLPGETLAALFEVELAAGAAVGVAAPSEPNSVIRSSADRHGGTAVREVRGDAEEAWCVRVAARLPGSEGQSPYYGLSSGAVGSEEFAEASVDFRFAVAVGLFGEVLRAGPEQAARLDDVERWARAAVGEDAGGYRAELIALIEQAQRAARR